MSFFLLPRIQYNNQLGKHIQVDNLFKPYKSKIQSNSNEINIDDILINKTLYKYLSF